jgi:hypothetical protein
MKDVFVRTRNVVAFINAIEAVHNEKGPKMILTKGQPGRGKTKTMAWYTAHNKAVYLEAEAGWNIGWLLDDLCFELGVRPEHKLSSRSRQVKDIIRKERPVLIIDEADLLRHDKKVLETIKSIHDRCDVPVVLVGTSEIEQEVRRYSQLSSRVVNTVDYSDISKAELPAIISQLAEVTLDDTAMKELTLHIRTMRDVVRFLPHIERAVKGKNARKADDAVVRAVADRLPKAKFAA